LRLAKMRCSAARWSHALRWQPTPDTRHLLSYSRFTIYDSERRHPCLRATGILPVKRRAGCARPADKDVGAPFTIRD